MPEDFRTFYADPGEDFGWSMGRDVKLLGGSTDKMWAVADDLWYALNNPYDTSCPMNSAEVCREGVDPDENTGPIGRIVCEDFRIYPWKVKELKWDRVRTARVIGALTFMARQMNIPFVLQGANIKAAAQSAGVEELYVRPLHENRHQNDSAQHFSFFTNTELRGLKLDAPDQTNPENYEVH